MAGTFSLSEPTIDPPGYQSSESSMILILRPLSPKTGYHFFEGGVGVGGGSKVFSQKAPSSGETHCLHTTAGRMVTQPMQSFWSAVRILVGQLPGGAGGATFAPPVFEPPTKKSAVRCITIRPLRALRRKVSPLLGAASATDKKAKLCVSV